MGLAAGTFPTAGDVREAPASRGESRRRDRRRRSMVRCGLGL